MAKRTSHTVRGNLAWTFGYDIAALGMLDPLVAGAAMLLPSLLVVPTACGAAAGRSDYQPQE